MIIRIAIAGIAFVATTLYWITLSAVPPLLDGFELVIGLWVWVGLIVWLVGQANRHRRIALASLGVIAVLGLWISAPSLAVERSREVTREFQRLHPCPATGKTTGACPGWIKDHIDPLCHGGRDAVSNMQWQTIEDAAIKDRWERRLCRHHAAAAGVSDIPYLE